MATFVRQAGESERAYYSRARNQLKMLYVARPDNMADHGYRFKGGSVGSTGNVYAEGATDADLYQVFCKYERGVETIDALAANLVSLFG